MPDAQPSLHRPSAQRSLPVAALTAVLLAVAALLASLAAVALALAASLETRPAVVVRGVLVLFAVALVCRAVARAAARRGVAAAAATVTAGAVLGYLAFPGAWTGRAAVSQALTDPGPATMIADLVLWTAVAAAAAWGAARQPAPQVTATPYG